MLSIAMALEGDMPRILEIEEEAISPPWTHGALLSEIYKGSSFFAVARGAGPAWVMGQGSGIGGREDGRVLGFVILRRVADEGELLQIAVDHSARRRGIADMLIKAALRHAHDSALSAVFLEVRKGNGAAIKLYEKHGFKPMRLRKDYYTDPTEDAVVMSTIIC